MDLAISDLPPPETVQGLWQRRPSAAVPDEAPGARAGVAVHADAVAGGVDVDLVGQDAEAPLVARPRSSARSGPRGR